MVSFKYQILSVRTFKVGLPRYRGALLNGWSDWLENFRTYVVWSNLEIWSLHILLYLHPFPGNCGFKVQKVRSLRVKPVQSYSILKALVGRHIFLLSFGRENISTFGIQIHTAPAKIKLLSWGFHQKKQGDFKVFLDGKSQKVRFFSFGPFLGVDLP